MCCREIFLCSPVPACASSETSQKLACLGLINPGLQGISQKLKTSPLGSSEVTCSRSSTLGKKRIVLHCSEQREPALRSQPAAGTAALCLAVPTECKGFEALQALLWCAGNMWQKGSQRGLLLLLLFPAEL